MKQGVESSRADSISMMPQLFHHRQAEDWLVRSVHKHMDANEAEEEFSLLL